MSLPKELLGLDWHLDETGRQGHIKVESVILSLPLFLDWIEERGHVLKQLQSRRMTLDDLFVSMTGRGLIESP